MCLFHLGHRRFPDSAARGIGVEARGVVMAARGVVGWRKVGARRRIGTYPAMVGWNRLMGRSMEQVPLCDDDSAHHGNRRERESVIFIFLLCVPIMN